MSSTPARRLAAGATAAAVLATTFLLPAAWASAEELPVEETTTTLVDESAPQAPAAADPVAEEPAPEQPAADPTAPAEVPAEVPAAEIPVAEEPADAAADAPEKILAKTEGAAPAAAPASAPSASLIGTASTIPAGQTWTAQATVDDATSLRAVAIGSNFVLTITDSSGATETVAAANGEADIWLAAGTPDGVVDIAIQNTAGVAQSIPYAFGWETSDIRSTSVMSQGQPKLAVSTYPSRGGVDQTATGNARVMGLDRVVHTLPLSGINPRADFEGLAPGLYVVEVDVIVLGVHRLSARVSKVAAAETTPPTVTVTTTQQQATGGWFAGAVDVQIAATDAGAGVHDIGYAVDTSTLTHVTLQRVSTRIVDEGTHQVRYQATDNQNNTSALATRQINIDHTKPAATLNGFTEGQEFQQDEVVAIEYACTDALSGIQSCVGDLGSGDFLDTSTPGEHTFMVVATDKAGSTFTIERSYTVLEPDTTDPVIQIELPEDPESGWYLDTVTVRLTASDESGIRRIHYEYGTMQGTVSRDIEAETAEVTFDRTQLYTLEYWAEDTAGNRSEGQHLQFYVDSDAPWVNVMSPEELPSILPNGHYAQNEVVEVDFTCDDIGSGVVSCEGSTDDGENLPTGVPGTHELRIVAVDLAGHRTERVVEYIVDAAPAPGPGTGSGGGGTGTTGTPRLAATGTDLLVTGAALAFGLVMLGALALTVRRLRRN
jgi:hypothetical protein